MNVKPRQLCCSYPRAKNVKLQFELKKAEPMTKHLEMTTESGDYSFQSSPSDYDNKVPMTAAAFWNRVGEYQLSLNHIPL